MRVTAPTCARHGKIRPFTHVRRFQRAFLVMRVKVCTKACHSTDLCRPSFSGCCPSGGLGDPDSVRFASARSRACDRDTETYCQTQNPTTITNVSPASINPRLSTIKLHPPLVCEPPTLMRMRQLHRPPTAAPLHGPNDRAQAEPQAWKTVSTRPCRAQQQQE